MKLNKYLSYNFVASRRKSAELVKAGRVAVDGKVEFLPSREVNENNKVEVDGKEIVFKKKKPVVYMLNKPSGYVVSHAQFKNEKNVYELLPKGQTLYPVGRLDKESEGLILFTNDGDLDFKLSHPRFQTEKEYIVTVGVGARNLKQTIGLIIQEFKKGIVIDGKKTKPADIKLIDSSALNHRAVFNIVLHEGRNRQIRQTVERLGIKVTGLKRTRVGRVKIGDLKIGKYQPVDPKKI